MHYYTCAACRGNFGHGEPCDCFTKTNSKRISEKGEIKSVQSSKTAISPPGKNPENNMLAKSG